MKAISRLILLLSALFLLAHYLPNFYWILFSQRVRVPYISYSCLKGDFLSVQVLDEQVSYTDSSGKTLTQEQYESALPFQNAVQLIKDGRMPEEICGVSPSYQTITYERSYIKVEPDSLDSPLPKLFPLFESGSGRVELKTPKDFLRLGERVEFLDARSNQLDEAKSQHFSRALEDADFQFPARLVAGNPESRKPYDEGLYALDAKGRLFRIRMIRGAPDVVPMELLVSKMDAKTLAGLDIQHIIIDEQNNRNIRALLIERNSRLWVLHGKDYRLSAIPLEGYDCERDVLSLRGDVLHYTFIRRGENAMHYLALDRDFEPVAAHIEAIPEARQGWAASVARVLLPLELNFEDPSSAYLGFYWK